MDFSWLSSIVDGTAGYSADQINDGADPSSTPLAAISNFGTSVGTAADNTVAAISNVLPSSGNLLTSGIFIVAILLLVLLILGKVEAL